MNRLRKNKVLALIAVIVVTMVMALSLAGCGIDTAQVAGAASAIDDLNDAAQDSAIAEQDSDIPAQDSAIPAQNSNNAEQALDENNETQEEEPLLYDSSEFLKDIPEWSGNPFCDVNEGVPDFTEDEIWTSVQESLAPLDSLGRCGTASSCIGVEGMPTEPRGNISEIHPTGWHTDEYDFVEGGKLYNRCHLIAHMLSGDDAIDRNLVTGTSYMNRQGMLPFEQAIADYVTTTNNHVMYRVTPIFAGEELVCRGVHIEAVSVEDNGEGIAFNKYCYNVEPGVEIDYATGDNKLAEETSEAGVQADSQSEEPASEVRPYILNTNTHKFHYPECKSVSQMKDKNKQEVEDTRENVIAKGYEPCGNCHP